MVLAPTRFSLVRISIRDLVPDRNPSKEIWGWGWGVKFLNFDPQIVLPCPGGQEIPTFLSCMTWLNLTQTDSPKKN